MMWGSLKGDMVSLAVWDVGLPSPGRQGGPPGTCFNAGRDVFVGRGMIWWMSKGLEPLTCCIEDGSSTMGEPKDAIDC